MNLNISKPSRKIIALIVVATITILFMAINKWWTRDSVSKSKVEQANVVTPEYTTFVGDSSTIDSDQNGIPDWKQMIAGTSTKTTSNEESAPKTVSESVARSLFANAVYLSNNGQNNISSNDQDTLANNLVSTLQQSFTYKEYGASGMNISYNPSQDDIKDYASKFASFQIAMILEMQSKLGTIQGNVGALASIYDKEASNLYTLKVPAKIATSHLQVVNNFSRVASALRAIANEKEDPIQVPLAIRIYQDSGSSQETEIRTISDFIKNSGIIFGKDEEGAYWNAIDQS